MQELIRLSDIHKTFKSPAGDFTALRGINLSVGCGEFVSIVGKSGSGKTTLMNIITGVDRPSQGRVVVAGADLTNLSESRLAAWRGKNVGIVFQFFQLLPTLSALENVMLPMDFCNMYSPRDRVRRAKVLLEGMGLEEHIHKRPGALSGGQQQRVAIARALANDPPLLIADEPTGNLDSNSSEQIFQLFARLTGQGKTVVIVTHDNDQANRVHRAILLSDGSIVPDTGESNG